MNLASPQPSRPATSAISRVSRKSWIDDHAVVADLSRWNENLLKRGLPGAPVRGSDDDGVIVELGRGVISRGDLFELGRLSTNGPDEAATLLWSTIAWGSGTRFRLCHKRLDAVVADPAVTSELAQIAALSRVSAEDAYEAMCPKGAGNLIAYLGPAFATKFLYFAGGGEPSHPCLILDDRVNRSLLASHVKIPTYGAKWTSLGYSFYCSMLHDWAGQATVEFGRLVGGDEYERVLFEG